MEIEEKGACYRYALLLRQKKIHLHPFVGS